MTASNSFAMFQRTVERRFSDCKEAISRTVQVFADATASASTRKTHAEELRRACQDLVDILDVPDRPAWLQRILSGANDLCHSQETNTQRRFLDVLLRNYALIEPIKLTDDQDRLLDFDALYARIRDEGRIPELFDQLIGLVERIVASGEIESISVENALKQVLSVLRANRKGSYVAARQSIFITRYLKNLTFVYLEKLPVLKDLREAWNRTIDETEAELKEIDAQLTRDTQTVILKAVPHLERLSERLNEPLLRLSMTDNLDGVNQTPTDPAMSEPTPLDKADDE